MSDLDQFFAKSKKSAGKPTFKRGSKGGPADEKKEEVPAASKTPVEQEKVAAFESDSDDENATVVLNNDGSSKIKDRKEVEAKKRSKEEQKERMESGWGLGSKFGTTERQPRKEEREEKPALTKADGAIGISGFNFKGKGKPQFMKSSKKGIMSEDFPDLGTIGDAITKKNAAADKSDENVLGKDSDYSLPTRSKPSEPQAEKPAATKPIFTGKAKLKIAQGAAEEKSEIANVSYDISKLGIGSTATDKTVPREERESGHREERKRGGYKGAAAGGDDFDDDFETVTDKKQVRGTKKNFDPETAFASKNRSTDKPSFSRGGAPKR